MKKLTKKQRHEIYRKAEIVFNDTSDSYLCNLMAQLRRVSIFNRNKNIERFDELILLKPDDFQLREMIKKTNRSIWFETFDERYQALLFAIEMTRP